MFQNKNIVLRAPWQLLIAAAAVCVAVVFGIVSNLLSGFAASEIGAIVALIAGTAVSVGGYILTRRSRYEVYPTHRQFVGALLNGMLLTICLFALLSVLTSSLTAGLFLVAIAGAIEFLMQRTFQARKIKLSRIIAACLAFGAIGIFAKADPVVANAVYVFAGAFLAKELLGRYTKTYLLSPWVNSIWNGGVIALAGIAAIIFLPESAAFAANDALSLPLWVGLLTLCVGVTIVVLQFLKRKIVIARGYLQHKMQLWTVLLTAVAYFSSAGGFSNEVLVSFVLLVVLYSLAEASISPKG